jgi:hypothetical protein
MASYEIEVEALDAVVSRAHLHGPDSIMSIALIQVDDEDEDGAIVTLASGADLLARAKKSRPLRVR